MIRTTTQENTLLTTTRAQQIVKDSQTLVKMLKQKIGEDYLVLGNCSALYNYKISIIYSHTDKLIATIYIGSEERLVECRINDRTYAEFNFTQLFTKFTEQFINGFIFAIKFYCEYNILEQLIKYIEPRFNDVFISNIGSISDTDEPKVEFELIKVVNNRNIIASITINICRSIRNIIKDIFDSTIEETLQNINHFYLKISVNYHSCPEVERQQLVSDFTNLTELADYFDEK